MLTLSEKRRITFFIYATTFLSSIGYAFVIYINSSFLAKYVPETYLGLIYGIGSVITLVSLLNISHILRRFGQRKTTIAILLIESAALGSSAILDRFSACGTTYEKAGIMTAQAILFFLLFSTSSLLLRFSLDVYLEKFSRNKDTGESRGIFLTTINLAIAIAPTVVGNILKDGEYYKVFCIAALIFVPVLAIVILKLKKVPDVPYHDPKIGAGFEKVFADKNIRNIFISNFLLEFFYCLMVIYTPLYMHQYVGFSWEDIGKIFSIMLTSFVLIQLPLGKLADRYFGEKEILTAGFIIAGLSTAYLTILKEPAFYIWAAVLFMTRIGAASIEIMNETYFFKKVSARDSDVISFFRNASPSAYIAGPIASAITLYFLPMEYIFLVLGIIMISGVRFSLAIEDTK